MREIAVVREQQEEEDDDEEDKVYLFDLNDSKYEDPASASTSTTVLSPPAAPELLHSTSNTSAPGSLLATTPKRLKLRRLVEERNTQIISAVIVESR